MFFELVSISFAIVLVYGKEYMTKENENWTSFKNFAPKLNLNHNIDNTRQQDKRPIEVKGNLKAPFSNNVAWPLN